MRLSPFMLATSLAICVAACHPWSEWDDPADKLTPGQIVGDAILTEYGAASFSDHRFVRWESREGGVMYLTTADGREIKLCRTGFETPDDKNRVTYGRCF